MTAAPLLPVKTLVGHEPGREGEYPPVFQIGSPLSRGGCDVDLITYREAGYGDHGGWFDVYANGRVVASIAARAVAEIYYIEEGGE